ncbi:putative fungal Zn(2)-cys(6) binuclear cluster domain protein [Rhizoctonia solani 123E]|uniref:Putative fungal Zn(2)-cys(6) binuclear cluster domain protein n=1 Tax=Rhizoctonia solani 123E TaxID=1423351 RepID=A0A074RWC9_9AGAM|nr:putative fungal Zn(2)-cys(6) binuclear cluster domain protein [Rhizoctonia solani 123E]
MMTRSTGGCYTCKRRKKKCDETKPRCVRCSQSGRECEGYAPLEGDSRGIRVRAKSGLEQTAESVSQHRPFNFSDSVEGPSWLNASTSLNTSGQQISSSSLRLPSDSGSRFSQPSQPSNTEDIDSLPPPETIWNPDTLPTNSTLLTNELPVNLPSQRAGPPPMFFDVSNPAGYYEAMTSSYESTYSETGGDDLEDDAEGTKQEMCIMPALDPNTPDNALLYVLRSYARWMTLVVFEPSKAIHPLKEIVVNKFMHSPAERSKIILLSNAIGSLAKTFELGPQGTSLIAHLHTEACQNLSNFIADRHVVEHEIDMQNGLAALDLMEVILVQRYSGSLLSLVRLMEAAAPVFRRVCPEPTDQYVNLPRAIFSPMINIRHFATTDIIISITTGRPMLFRYNVDYPPDILDQMTDGRYGMHWLHGIADQYIVLLARINNISEEYGANVSPQCVSELEDQIREAGTSTERSADPISTIWRFVVWRCWKLTMQIYLYMVLCRASADDPRVLKLVKAYVQLTETVNPGRNPDAFLYIPMIIVGVSAHREQDRAVIQQRMLSLEECNKPGCCGYEAMNMLVDLWRRIEAENRPAVWTDLRLSAFRVAHV